MFAGTADDTKVLTSDSLPAGIVTPVGSLEVLGGSEAEAAVKSTFGIQDMNDLLADKEPTPIKKDAASLEALLNGTEPASQTNSLKNYGILKVDLREINPKKLLPRDADIFKRRAERDGTLDKVKGREIMMVLNYYEAQDVFRGMYNVDIPHAMLQQMNPSEIIALFYGTKVIKRAVASGKPFSNFAIHEGMPLEALVTRIHEVAYNGRNYLEGAKHSSGMSLLKEYLNAMQRKADHEYEQAAQSYIENGSKGKKPKRKVIQPFSTS